MTEALSEDLSSTCLRLVEEYRELVDVNPVFLETRGTQIRQEVADAVVAHLEAGEQVPNVCFEFLQEFIRFGLDDVGNEIFGDVLVKMSERKTGKPLQNFPIGQNSPVEVYVKEAVGNYYQALKSDPRCSSPVPGQLEEFILQFIQSGNSPQEFLKILGREFSRYRGFNRYYSFLLEITLYKVMALKPAKAPLPEVTDASAEVAGAVQNITEGEK